MPVVRNADPLLAVTARLAVIEDLLRGVLARLDQTSDPAVSPQPTISEANADLLKVISTCPTPTRFQDIVAASLTARIIHTSPEHPMRHYNALHARVNGMTRKGILRRTGHGCFRLSDIGRRLVSSIESDADPIEDFVDDQKCTCGQPIYRDDDGLFHCTDGHTLEETAK